MPPKQHMKIKFIYGVTLPRLHAQAEALIKNATKAMVKKHVVSKILEVWCGGIIKGLLSHPKRRFASAVFQKNPYYQARLALKIPSEAKNPDGNGISVEAKNTADEFFPINISIYFSKYI